MSDAFALIEVFYPYAHKDESFLKKLQVHLRGLQRQTRISIRYGRQMSTVADLTRTIETIDIHLKFAPPILLSVIADNPEALLSSSNTIVTSSS